MPRWRFRNRWLNLAVFSADSKATIVTSGYMDAAYDELALGDVVTCVTSTTPPTAFITYVKTRASAVVALAGGLVITA
jgi:hypothetical protein